MSRRPVNLNLNPSRRFGDSGRALLSGSSYSKSESSRILLVALVAVGALLLLPYSYSGRGDYSCTVDVQRAISILKKAYGDSTHKRMLVEVVCKDIVRVVDIKYLLPYRPKSFSLVLVSYALDYLSERYLNRTLPDLARVSADGLVVCTGYPCKLRAKAAEVSKFGRAAKLRSTSWWSKFFGQASLEEDDDAAKKFNEAATKMSYVSNCQVFHLRSFN